MVLADTAPPAKTVPEEYAVWRWVTLLRRPRWIPDMRLSPSALQDREVMGAEAKPGRREAGSAEEEEGEEERGGREGESGRE